MRRVRIVGSLHGSPMGVVELRWSFGVAAWMIYEGGGCCGFVYARPCVVLASIGILCL